MLTPFPKMLWPFVLNDGLRGRSPEVWTSQHQRQRMVVRLGHKCQDTASANGIATCFRGGKKVQANSYEVMEATLPDWGMCYPRGGENSIEVLSEGIDRDVGRA